MSRLQKWQLLKAEDVSPSPFFPLEKRSYRMPNGKQVDDFYVTTLADCVQIVAITTDKKLVMIRMYKQGADRIVTQFPAGRIEAKHASIEEAAVRELEEETGIKVSPEQLIFVTKLAIMSTKASEFSHLFVVPNVTINSTQNLDDNEEIEVLLIEPREFDALIDSGEIIDNPTIATWYLLNKKFPELLAT